MLLPSTGWTMEDPGSSEMSAHIYQTVCCHNVWFMVMLLCLVKSLLIQKKSQKLYEAVLKRFVCALLNDGDSWRNCNVNGMKITGETVSTRKNTYPNATLSAKDSTWTGLGWNTGFLGEKRATNGLRVNADESLSVCLRLVTRMYDRIVRH
jgi:hypothetical protein